jgi:hypothetical protein
MFRKLALLPSSGKRKHLIWCTPQLLSVTGHFLVTTHGQDLVSAALLAKFPELSCLLTVNNSNGSTTLGAFIYLNKETDSYRNAALH